MVEATPVSRCGQSPASSPAHHDQAQPHQRHHSTDFCISAGRRSEMLGKECDRRAQAPPRLTAADGDQQCASRAVAGLVAPALLTERGDRRSSISGGGALDQAAGALVSCWGWAAGAGRRRRCAAAPGPGVSSATLSSAPPNWARRSAIKVAAEGCHHLPRGPIRAGPRALSRKPAKRVAAAPGIDERAAGQKCDAATAAPAQATAESGG